MELGFSLGSNLGDRLANLIAAKDHLLRVPGTRLAAQSPVYETTPVDVRAEFRNLKFLNCVLIAESDLLTEEWLSEIGRIETRMGRRRSPDRNSPRPIDIDILYAGGGIIDSGGLTLPHARWAERRFVVQPLADVRPNLILPGVGRTVREVLANLAGSEEVKLFSASW